MLVPTYLFFGTGRDKQMANLVDSLELDYFNKEAYLYAKTTNCNQYKTSTIWVSKQGFERFLAYQEHHELKSMNQAIMAILATRHTQVTGRIGLKVMPEFFTVFNLIGRSRMVQS